MSATVPPQSLWRHREFLRLWVGQTASQFGEQIGLFVIPVLAVTVLHVTAFEIGLLEAAETLAFLLIGLPAGAWIDRWVKRRVMLRTDFIRVLLLSVIPVLWLLGVLEFWHLLVVGTAVGIASVFFDVSYQSFIPVLVGRDQISDANGKVETTAQVAHIAGPAAAGAAVTIIAAPLVLFATATTYLISFLALLGIRDGEVAKPREDRRPLVVEIREGLSFVFHQPLLRRIVLSVGIGNFFTTLVTTLLPLLVLRELEISTAAFGIAISIGAVGGLIGAALATRIARFVGEGTVIPLSAIGFALVVFLAPAMAIWPEIALPLLVIAQFLFSFTVLVFNVTQVSFRQRICPPELLGRMNASIRFVVWGVIPLSALTAGVLASVIGILPTMLIGAFGNLISVIPILFSPLLGMRRLPDAAVTEVIGEN